MRYIDGHLQDVEEQGSDSEEEDEDLKKGSLF